MEQPPNPPAERQQYGTPERLQEDIIVSNSRSKQNKLNITSEIKV